MKLEKMNLDSKKMKILAICLAVGIIFLFLSEYSVLENKGSENTFDEEEYTARLEERLSALLEEIQGVSDVKVMVTLKGGQTYRYAKQNSQNLSESATSTQTFLQMQEEAGGISSPILTQTLLPEIKGVSVVCRGGGNVAVEKKIIGVIKSTLNLNENQIFVTE